MLELTKPQKLIYDMEKFAGGSIATVCGSIIIKGKKDVKTLLNAANELYRLNDALRIKITETDGVPYQNITKYKEQEINILRFKDKAELNNYAENFAREPMDFYGSLCHMQIIVLDNAYGILVKLHHIISDAWTLALIGSQFNSILKGETPESYSYLDYISSEQKYIEGKRYQKDKDYYIEQFKKCDETTYLSDKQVQSYTADRKTFVIDKEKTSKIAAYANDNNTSLFMLLMTALGVYINRIKMNQEKFYVGTAVLNRNGLAEQNTMGMFINTVPVLFELENNSTFKENLDKFSENMMTMLRHQKFNYGDVLKSLRREFDFTGNLYDVMLSYQNAKMTGMEDDFESTWYHCGMQTESLQMHIDDRDSEGILKIHYDYLTEKFTEKEIERMHEHIFNLLFDAINEDKKITTINILSEKEKNTLLCDFNDTKADYSKDKCVHQLFEEQVLKAPDKTAVIACDKTLTYDELNKLSNRIANSLIEKDVKSNDIIAFALPRNSYLIAVMFGILKSGAAYMPIDPDYPQDRIDYMISDSNAKFFITEDNINEFISINEKNPKIYVSPDNYYCALHTSGSTGTPKMSLLYHKSIMNFLYANTRFYDNIDTVVSATIITFDAFIMDSVLAISYGKLLYLMSNDEMFNQNKFEKVFKNISNAMFFSTPTKLKSYIDNSTNKEFVKNIKSFVLGGEIFTEDLFDLINENTDNSNIYNIYGPTETTICVVVDELKNHDITIGKPIANTQIYILDKCNNPMPIGQIGELCIAGDGVGAGYLNRLELTAEKFIDNPFDEGKMYKTGDLAYWREDGNIAYVGRNDFQVKIRGLRIELGEIESAIDSVDGISQAVVVVRKDANGRQLICAFYTEQKSVDIADIKSAISSKLPKYMMPHIFTVLEEMPLTSSGKINRKALPEVDLTNISNDTEYIAPTTEKEIVLTTEIASVLHLDRVGVLDNFFDLGGDSLKSIELISKLESKGYKATVKTVFDCETVKDLAERLEQAEAEITPFEWVGDIPATDAQMRVYTAQSMQENSTLYNIPYCFKTDNLDADRLQNAINKLIARHEALRTHFENKDGHIIQIINDKVECNVEKLSNDNILDFIRPFDLEKAPLIRVGYYENTVMVDIHHIITDGSSMPVFFNELNELYMGRTLDNAPVQYKEFAVQTQDHTDSEKYWLSVFDNEVPVLEINTDFSRGNKQTHNGSALYDTIDIELHNKIKDNCKELNITPYAFYMSGFNILLSKFSGCEDIVVGMPISGRESKFLNTIGMFVNTIALRNKPVGTKSVSEFLTEVKENSINAIANQDYPFGELIKKLNIDAQNRNPLFDVMFAYQSEEMTDVVFGDKKAELLSVPITTSKYDLTLNVMPRENDVVLMAEYCTDLYKENTIQRMINGFKKILCTMLNEIVCMQNVSAVSKQEKNFLLYDFNNTKADYPKDKCVHQLFEEQVLNTPDKTAVIACDKTLTYDELNKLSNKIANSLIEKGVKANDIVAFALPRNSYLIAVMFGILKSSAAYMPIDSDYPQDRIEYMLEDSDAKFFITEDNLNEFISDDEENPNIEMISDNYCYCIYTSGTTGNPKGTIIAHRNVSNFINKTSKSEFQNTLLSKCEYVLALSSITFDISLQEIHLPLINGLQIILLTEQQSNDIGTAINLLNEKNIGLIATPTRLSMYMSNINFCRKLRNFSVIMSGAESFPSGFYSQIRKYTEAEIFNGYGPTETTCGVLYSPINSDENVTIGKPIANTQIYILDKYNNPMPLGQIGELCIAGDGVGAGYLNRPELTAEKFIDNPFGEGKMYKTGDLAYWREDGNIAYVGRNDFQVKIRGLRIELGEIESAIDSVDGISQAVVVVRKDENGRQLICAFYTEQKSVDVADIKSAISSKLPKYMMPHIFTVLEEMPLTTSGKINRKTLPEVDLTNISNDTEYVAPATEKEIILCQTIENILNAERVGTLDNFFDLGGDSLKAIELISKLESKGYKTTVKTVFDCETIKELAEKLERAEVEIAPFEWVGDIPAADAQMRVYTAQSMQENSTLYNIPYCFKTDNLDVDRLQNAINKLITRHEALRTHFENKDGHIIQIINDKAECKVEKLGSDNVLDFIKPFNLGKAPLIRVGCYENTVMVDIHHIITDGSSMPVFFNELNELYMGRTLEDKVVQYKEFAVQTQDHAESEKYWLSVFDDEVPVLEINTDFPRGNKQTHNGSALYDTIDVELHNKIKDKCKELNITPYAFYMSGFNILLSKFSGNEDIVVGMPISGRDSKFLNTMGMFVNTIALRNKPVGTKTVSEFLTEVKESSINAIANQDYPFGELIKKLNIETSNRNPLFDVMFAYQSEEMTDVVFGDMKAELLTIPVITSKYDLTLNVMPRENDVVLMAEYCTDLYKESTMKRIINGFKQILSNMLDTGVEIKDIDVLSEFEKNTLLYDFNDTKADYPKDKCVHQLFEEQVLKTPDKTAVIACDKTLTYDELNKLSNRIANSLVEKGVKANDIVAFALPRNSYLIAVMFGVLESGAAYLPIDLDFPQDRVEYMIADSGSKFYITENNLQDFISDNEDNPKIEMTSDNYCYCIYTSGTTGKPKGTIIRHRNLINFCNNNRNNYQSCMINYGTRLISTFKCCFDAFGVDYALFLLNGLSLVLANDYEMTHAEDLAKLIKKHNVDVIHSTPSTIKAFCGNEKYVEAIKKAKIIMVAAENFTPDLYEFLQNHTSAKFFNGYGPSETTIGVSFGEINSTDITIGKPIANTQIYIVDKYNKPMPLGQIGELCIAGDGVGAGYLNRPELTAKKFIDNPFGEDKMYKTGDLAYWREDGNIAYVGRNDFQVKIRGLRIELGEIESAIDSVDGVSQAVVVVRKDANGRQLICAFYTEQKPVDVAEIKSAISSKLPKYMMPHIFTVLSEMPLTSSGKINRKALPEVDLTNTNADAEYVKPENKLQQEIAAVMEKVLDYSPIGLNDDFFDLGGDSLKAIEFVSKAHSEGIYFNLQAVFDNPTVAKLYDYIECGDKQAVLYEQADFDKYIPLLENNKVECIELPQKSALGNVFITGSTGFLGSHIIDELLSNDVEKVYCLVRNDEQRLYDMLSFYFGDKYKDDARIIPVIGDLEHLADVKVEDSVDLVIHTAASVKHYGSYQYFYDMNVGGTLNAIDFCKNHNAKLIHISTLSVSGNAMLDVAESFKSETELFFDETTLFMGQPLENVYARSKFEAEKAVLDAMLEGLEANIIRVGNLTNRVSDAKFQKNHESNAFLNRFKAVLELKVFPEYLMSLYAEFSPVDDTAKGIVKIAEYFNNKHTVFNLNSYKPLYFDKFVEILKKLDIEMNIVDGKTFIDKIKLPGSEEIYEALINDMDENGNLVYDSNIRILNDFTKEYMKLLGFEWSEIDFEYMKRYVEYFRNIGYLEV